MSTMPEDVVRALERKIESDSDQLQEQFSSLCSRTQQYLLDTNCNVRKLLVCVMNVRHVKLFVKKSPLVNLKKATSISDLFLELVENNLVTFLQFSILERVIKDICSESQELQSQLMEYQERYKIYMTRRVCETQVYHEGRFEEYIGPVPGATSHDPKQKEDKEKIDLPQRKWNWLFSQTKTGMKTVSF